MTNTTEMTRRDFVEALWDRGEQVYSRWGPESPPFEWHAGWYIPIPGTAHSETLDIGSYIEASNREALDRDFPDVFDRTTDAYGCESLAIELVDPEETLEGAREALEALDALTEYAIYDEMHASDLLVEWTDAYWNDFVRPDLESIIEDELYDDVPERMRLDASAMIDAHDIHLFEVIQPDGPYMWCDVEALADTILREVEPVYTLDPAFDPTTEHFHTEAAFRVRVAAQNRELARRRA